jgi:serine/threonine protein kinase
VPYRVIETFLGISIFRERLIEKISNKLFILMEFIDGGTLRDYLNNSVSNITKSIDLALQICEGMEYACSRLHLVHRDLKPENILLTQTGVAKIADFGLAETPQYMSPEQFKAPKYVDTRSDVYSFGVMFYEMVTSKRPFTANTFEEYESKHLDDPPLNPMLLNSKIPKEICSILMKCLEKYPEKRYQTFHDLKNDIKMAYEKLDGYYLEPEVTGLLTAFDLTFDGFILANLNEFEDAANCFNAAINIDAEYTLSWVGKGVSLLKNQKISDAKDCFSKASKLDPGLKNICDSFGGLVRCLEPNMNCPDCETSCLEINTHGYPSSIHEHRFVCPNCGEEYIYDPLDKEIIRITNSSEVHFAKNGRILEKDEKPKH